MAAAESLLACCDVEEDRYAVGRTRLFLRQGVLGELERRRLEYIGARAATVQATARGMIGRRYAAQPTDTVAAEKRLPLFEYQDWNDFCEGGRPRGAALVAVEMGGEPLEGFVHPRRAVYVLGSEDAGVPQSVLRACDHHVALPSVRYESYNLAVAGAIVMVDRLVKSRAAAQKAD